ncbi:MAG: hypothetical protein K6G36_03510 [Candidatus Saccharibacteria bacterium]|nr:hypothetical protein [Candidatus Saccharibacteria bacterium]
MFSGGVRIILKKTAVVLLFMMTTVTIFGGNKVFAEGAQGFGQFISGGTCGQEGETKDWWDTCFGFSWQHYEWPAGWTQDIKMPGTNNSGRATIAKECANEKYGGGFWFLGFEVYKPNLLSSGLETAVRGFQAGAPLVAQLRPFAGRVSPMQTYGTSGVGLYPVVLVSKDNQGRDVENYGYFDKSNNGRWDILHEEFTQKPKSNPYMSDRNSDWGETVLKGEYYGSTYEVFDVYSHSALVKSNTGNGVSDFSRVNWFCAGDGESIKGRSGVSIDYGSTTYTDWTTRSNPDRTNPPASASKTVADETVVVTFYHQIKGSGNTTYSVMNDNLSFKAKQSNLNDMYIYGDTSNGFSANGCDGDGCTTIVRPATFNIDDLSTGTTTMCDTLSYSDGGQQRKSKACAELVKNDKVILTTQSTVKVPKDSTEDKQQATSEASAAGNGETKTVNYDVTVTGSSASVDVLFVHTLIGSAESNSASANVSYKIEQSTNNSSATVERYDTVTGTKKITVASSSSVTPVTADESTITISNITGSTDITVCQEMTATHDGTDMKTKVCAHIKGNNFAVSGRSSVSSGDVSTTTDWRNDSKTASTSRTIYKPYNGTAATTAYFTHDLKAKNSDSIEAYTGNITYSIKRGDTYIQGQQNKTYSFTTSEDTHAVYGSSVDVPLGTTCQTLEFSYNTYSGAPRVCIDIIGESPTFKGKSEVSASDSKKTSTSTNNDTANLDTIKIKVPADSTGKQTISFKHDITATSTRGDAKNQSTGTMPFTIVKSYASNYEGNFTKTFPGSGSMTVAGEVSSGSTDVYVAPGETKVVCETLQFSGWSTKACATVVGELSLPSVKSQTTAKHKNTSKSSGWATKTSPNKTAESFEILVPMLPSVSTNGGIDMPVTFIHDIEAAMTTDEIDTQNTGYVPYTLTTSGTTDNQPKNDNFHIEVKKTAIGNELVKVNTITSDKVANVRIGQTTTVCQTLSFTYDGVARSTTACANFRGISADPKGASKVTVNGCGGGASVSTGYEADGAIVWLDIDGCSEASIKGSDIVFDHSFSIGGEMSVDIPFSTTNSCSDSNSCENNYSKTYNASSNRPLYQYEGHSGTARTVVWLYRKVLSDGTITNTYERSPAITDEDAKNMYNIGAACETLSFEYDGTWHNTTACVRFKNYNPCPELGSIGTTASTSYVKKYLGSSATSPTPDQTSVVYAKPTDNIEFMHCYYPGAQATRYTNDIESNYANSSNNGKYINIPLRNAFVEQQNQFSIGNKTGTDSFVGNSNSYTYTQGGQIMVHPEKTSNFIGVVGNPASTSVTSSRTAITTNAVGHEIEQSLLDHPGTNSVAGHDRGNCGSGCVVYYQNADDNKWYDITKRNSDSAISESSSAKVIVPYNYRTTASIDANSEYVYAGEGISGQNVKIRVNQRYNAKADDTYATKTAESTVKLYMFYTTNTNPNEGGDHQRAGSNLNACAYYGNSLGFSNCAELPAKDGAATSGLVFNANSDINPSPDKPESVSTFMSDYNVPDLPAGSKVCMGVTVYPAESTDTEPSNGNTFVSKAYCRTVAKKPSFQVWGGSVYASGNIAANLATKYTINGIYDYNMIRANGAPSITFGSWAEQAIMANGVVTGLASGAATGYGKVGLVVNTEYPGGSKSSKYCDMSRLSLANTLCQSNKTGRFGISGESATKTTLKEKYASKAKVKDASRNDDKYTYVSLNLSNAGSYTEEDGVRYTFAESNLTIEATGRLAAGTMHVVYAKGNIVIRGSSLLYNDGTLQNLNDVPQYIIIAEGNIYIEPSVTRVDAVLLAEKTINTCAKLSGNSVTEASKAGSNLITGLYCNKQLKINGTLIADALKLYRIFGASTGLNSVVPAEIINYSPSLYLWESSRVEEKHIRSLYTTYLHELAPRQ